MYNELLKYLKRPALYERTAEKFWTDPHIAAEMLKSHLDPDTDAASFRHEYIDRSAEWIASLPLPANARLLDIGCGPGLYAKRFSERGLRVTGLDFSENSVAYARAHDADSEYLVGDYLKMNFTDAFDIVTLINCDYGALIPCERGILLNLVCRALKPGGLFLFDVFTPLSHAGKSERKTWEVFETGGFMSRNPHVCMYGDYYYGDVADGSRIVVVEESCVRCFNLWNCCFTKQTLADEVAPAGFATRGFYNHVAGEPYTEDTRRICAIFEKTPA